MGIFYNRCLVVLAAAAFCQSTCFADFFPAQDEFFALKLPLASLLAFTGAYIPGDDGATYCDSTVISDDGSQLLAAHCLPSCIIPIYLKASGNPLKPKDYQGTSCMNMDYGDETHPYPVSWTVTAISPCLGDWVKGTGLEQYYSPKCPDGLDYIVITPSRPLPKIGGSSSDCVRVSKLPARIGDKVLKIGHVNDLNRTIKAKIKDKYNLEAYITYGQIVHQNFCQVNPHSQLPVASPHSNLIGNYEDEGYSQTTLDSIPGNSGGGIVNQNLDLVGMNDWIMNNGSSQECYGTDFMLRIDKILDSIRAQGLNPDKVFSCNKSSIDLNYSFPFPACNYLTN